MMNMNMNSRSSLPPIGRSSALSLSQPYNTKPELSTSSNFPPKGPAETSSYKQESKMPSQCSRFSSEIIEMPGSPPKNTGHRRVHSDVLALLDDVSFYGDLGGVGGGSDGNSLYDETEDDLLPEYLVSDKFNSISESCGLQGEEELSAADGCSSHERRRLQHSQSMVLVRSGDTDILKPEPSPDESHDKSISAANLAELALTDPKRAKRIWANRQSAARSKERKMRYIVELQSKVQIYQTEKASLSMQFALLQGDTSGLASENIELKLQLQSIEQQVHLQDALNDALKEEIQHLKVLTGQATPNGQPLMNQNYHNNNHAMNGQPLQYQFRQHQLDQFQPRQLLLH